MVDNRNGFSASISNKQNEHDPSYVDITYQDIKIYGEMSNPDCPQGGEGGFCNKFDKYGLDSASGTWEGKDFHISTTESLPPIKVNSIASFYTQVTIIDMEFHNFTSQTQEGMR